MTSVLGKVFKDLLWWGVPVAMVILYTVGFFPMLAFSLAVGIGSAILGDWSDKDVSPPAMVALLVAGSVAISPFGLAAQESEATPCPRGPMILYGKGIIQDVTNEPPCRLVFRPTGVRLAGVADGSRPDPGPLVVKDGRGRYYSANADGWESTVSVWNADGSYMSSFGRPGEGPGEFKGWWLSLFVDDGDTLHVLDSQDWMVFSPEHEFVRQVPSRLMEHGNILDESETFAPLYDGRMLASNAHPSTGDAYFRIVNRDGGRYAATSPGSPGRGTPIPLPWLDRSRSLRTGSSWCSCGDPQRNSRWRWSRTTRS